MFWSCLRAQKIWNCSGIFQLGFVGLLPSFLDLLWKMMMEDDCEENIIALVVTIAWSIGLIAMKFEMEERRKGN